MLKKIAVATTNGIVHSLILIIVSPYQMTALKPNFAADLRMFYPLCCWIFHITICFGEPVSIGVCAMLAEFTGLP